ncbi:hypothetical protein [Flavobacterium reichenbachii]|uniref:Lipoprotein n=1 Tax=Flavobacterium reichenbachii TaxID=362418 RepID=A0A085ZPP4_9FLAO|nr:hypothetical protein [Flavobacterium reichenbachii]KFF06408.1 hypothetical protein IW19_13195 [Flavobacterium reichenbachii]OXB14611.1 hypothetical protein B0A68_12280 [Flavobacterium reichenbachii]
MKSLKEYCLILFFTFSIFGCKDSNVEKKEEIKPQKENSNLNFDKVLKINDYVVGISEAGYLFTTSYDNGVYYEPKRGNDLGNLVTFLIPKDFLFFQKHSKYIKDDEYEPLEEYINKLSIEEYKKAFDIYVFLVDKKYLVPTPGYDSPYDYTKKYQTDLYQFKDNSWQKIESFNVDNEKMGNKENLWRREFIEKKSKELQTAFFNSISKLKIDDSWYRDYGVPLDAYEPNYSYVYYIKVAKDSSYIVERPLKDLLVPYQNGDTLFLYHKQCLLYDSKYLNNEKIPEVKIVKVKDKYYVTSEVFDLKNSISTKPEKYGFPVHESK